MEITLSKPYLISWLAIPILISTGILFSHHTLAIQLYDTYLMISNIHFALVGSALLLVIGIGYWLLSLKGKTPNVTMTLIHLLLTIGLLFLGTLPLFNGGSFVRIELIFVSIVVFLFVQFAYTVNILITLLWR